MGGGADLALPVWGLNIWPTESNQLPGQKAGCHCFSHITHGKTEGRGDFTARHLPRVSHPTAESLGSD